MRRVCMLLLRAVFCTVYFCEKLVEWRRHFFVWRVRLSCLIVLLLLRGAKLPAAPQNRRSRGDSNSPSVSPTPRHKLAAAVSSEGIASRTQISASQKPTRESRSGSTYSEKTHTRKLVKGEGTPPRRFQRSSSSRSDFLQQVADKLADRSTTSTAISESETSSPARTPMLPTLSPASSVATYVFMSSSDSFSGLSSDENEGSRRRRRSKSYSGSGTPASRRDRGKTLWCTVKEPLYATTSRKRPPSEVLKGLSRFPALCCPNCISSWIQQQTERASSSFSNARRQLSSKFYSLFCFCTLTNLVQIIACYFCLVKTLIKRE